MLSPQEELYGRDNAIAPFWGDEIAVLLLVYMLIFLGEAEVDVDRVVVTSKIWSPQRAFFVGWQEEGSFTYTLRSNSISERKVKETRNETRS